MRKFNKIISLLLAVFMIISAISSVMLVQVSADDASSSASGTNSSTSNSSNTSKEEESEEETREEIDYINAHGTSPELNDKFETLAIKNVFGDAAKKIAVSSTKGTTGHALGAAGGLESIACIKTIETGIIAPTINYETPDPLCDLDITPNKAVKKDVRTALNTNLGFGGHNGVVIYRRFED